MTERAFRKFVIMAGTIIAALVVIGIICYFVFKPKTTCFDGVQNQNETDIDCGGDCVSCEVKDLEELNIIDKASFLKQNDKYYVYQKVLNSNSDWGVQQYKYSFIILGESKSKEVKGSTYILPKQEKVIMEVVEVGFEIKKIEFIPSKVRLNDWAKKGTEELPNKIFEVSNVTINKGKENVKQIQKTDTPSYYFDKELKLGENNDQVKNLQAILAKDSEMYPEGIIDGDFTMETYKAVFRFQYKYNISPASGVVDEKTREKLNELYYYEGSPNTPSYLSFTEELKFGDKGQNVRDLQTILAKDKEIYPEGIINSEYGYLTRRAVERFQVKENIQKTGNLDLDTLKKINQVYFEDDNKDEIIGATKSVNGNIRNNSIFSFAKVSGLVFLCKEEEIKAISFFTLNKFYKESTQKFTVVWNKELPENLNICLIQIETNVFSRDNILK